MQAIKAIRHRCGLSQRRLAEKARISFRALQMLEAGETNPRLSSIMGVAGAFGISPSVVRADIESLLAELPDSVVSISRKIRADGQESWKLWMFEFVDAFRRHPSPELIDDPPAPGTSAEMRCLLASTVENLCAECGVPIPWWCRAIGPLPAPWFVSGIENLKACALAESPAFYRGRNIFVLGNFLDRA